FSATVLGSIKIVDEKKTIDDIKHKFLSKYSLKRNSETKTPQPRELVMIDSEEIQAAEEEGI
ncbi:MAG TPA: hypothetical protein VKD08_07095, partial [Ignavibacteriaceae bacterium]|nr:hypothetical protein [Ignavibacteriaceae bacterium]